MISPEYIGVLDSDGEKVLFNLFKKYYPGNSAFILHSVFIQKHIKNLSGEIDFLVLLPNHGFFCIEVKHGRVNRINGEWQYTNRYGVTTKSNKSPFLQVNVSMNSLRKVIAEKINNNPTFLEKYKKFLWGTGVAFTSLNEIPDISPEGLSWQVLTRQRLNNNLPTYLNNLSTSWHNEYKSKAFYDFNNSRPSIKDCEIIFKLIRGDFDYNYKSINDILDKEILIEQFTEEQFHTISITDYNDRCLIQGAAGTGKSILAIELFRKLAMEGKKIAFFCFNIKFADFLKDKLNHLSLDSTISNFHSFLYNGITNKENIESQTNSKDYYSLQLPFGFLLDNCYAELDKFDYLIIDEVQDIITEENLEVLDVILKGGIANGKWSFFGDFNNQSIFNTTALVQINTLNRKSFFVNVPELTINCRNTKFISSQNSNLTGIALPSNHNTQINGDKVHLDYLNESEINSFIITEIKSLIDNGIKLNKISVLTFKNPSNSSLSSFKDFQTLLNKGLQFTTVQSYKGLENSIIFLVDFLHPSEVYTINLLYVAISRARLKLYLLINQSLKNDYQKLISKNINF